MAGINDESTRNKSHRDSLAYLNLHLQGIPSPDFKLKKLPIIDAALGKYNDDGVTMLTVAHGADPRGPNCPASQNLEGNTDNNRKHALRLKRCHDLLISLYTPDCWAWKTMTEELAGDGYGLYDYIKYIEYRQPGPIAQDRMKVNWAKLSFSDLRIAYDHNTMTSLAGALLSRAKYQTPEKTFGEVLQKFVSISPKAISSKVVDIGERYDNGSLRPAEKFPANYPADYPVRSLRGKAHPDANHPDVMRIARHLQGHWDHLIDQGIVSVSDKFADIPEPDTKKQGKNIDAANFAGKPNGKGGRGKGQNSTRFYGSRGKGATTSSAPSTGGKKTREITSNDVCFACGGLGHLARIWKAGNMVPYCPTLIRGINVDKDTILSKIQYPHISNPRAEQAKLAADEEDEGEEEEEEESSDSSELEQCNFFGQV